MKEISINQNSSTERVKFGPVGRDIILNEKIEDETARAIAKETQLEAAIATAGAVKDVKCDGTSIVVSKVADIGPSIDTKVQVETTRATAAETTLTTNLAAETTARQTADTALQTNINNEATARTAADANLQEQVNNLKARGRYLSLWNSTTGLPADDPATPLPYAYKAGDYYIVGTVGTGTTLYKPEGTEYTGDASTSVETREVSINDVYYFDGTNWAFQSNAQKEVSFSGLAGNPTDNTTLATALNSKVDLTSEQTITGTKTFNGASYFNGNVYIPASVFQTHDIQTYNIKPATNSNYILGDSNHKWSAIYGNTIYVTTTSTTFAEVGALTLTGQLKAGPSGSPSAGTAGQVLTSNGDNAAPTWQDPSGGGLPEVTATRANPLRIWNLEVGSYKLMPANEVHYVYNAGSSSTNSISVGAGEEILTVTRIAYSNGNKATLYWKVEANTNNCGFTNTSGYMTSGNGDSEDTWTGSPIRKCNGYTAVPSSIAGIWAPYGSGGGSSQNLAGAVLYSQGGTYAPRWTDQGTAGQVLTSNGADAPTWTDAPTPSNMVTTDAAQTISGIKTFSKPIEFSTGTFSATDSYPGFKFTYTSSGGTYVTELKPTAIDDSGQYRSIGKLTWQWPGDLNPHIANSSYMQYDFLGTDNKRWGGIYAMSGDFSKNISPATTTTSSNGTVGTSTKRWKAVYTGDINASGNITDGTNSTTVADITVKSTESTETTGQLKIAVVTALPASPDPNTLYFIKEA